nr:MAG TPA: hypothetical protein [Bacteriophage sp.]
MVCLRESNLTLCAFYSKIARLSREQTSSLSNIK